MPKCIALNQTMWSQTQACINKSCEVCTLLRYYAAMSGNSMLTFRDNLSVLASRIKKYKRENRAHGKLNDTIFVCLYPSSNFLKAHNLLAAGSVSGLKQASPDMVGPLRLSYSQSLGNTETVTCQDTYLRTDLVQGNNRKMVIYLFVYYKLTTRLKNKIWTTPQIKHHKKSHVLRLIRQHA